VIDTDTVALLQVSLELERLYGSVDDIEVKYRIVSVDASRHWNFHYVQYSSVTMHSHQVIASITVQVTFWLTLHFSHPQVF